MAQPIDQCCQALVALYAANGSEESNNLRNQANQWLMAFTKKPIAWSVCDQILLDKSRPSNAHFFAAQTLRTKILYDYHDLQQPSQRVSFRNSLRQHLLTFAQVPTVRERLSLCMASLCVHQVGAGDWPDALPSLCAQLATPQTALILLDLLTYAPDEANSDKGCIPPKQRDVARASFRNYSPQVLDILARFINTTGSNRSLQQRVFACFLSWVRTEVPLQNLHTNALFKLTFQALNQPELQGVCCDVIVELLSQCSHRRRENTDPSPAGQAERAAIEECARIVVGRVLEMGSLWERTAAQRGMEAIEHCKKLALVFTQLGKSHMHYVTDCTPTGSQIMSLVLRASVHKDKDVASVTLHFWDALSQRIDQTLHRNAEQPPPIRPENLPLFCPFYAQLVQALVNLIQYPPEYDSWPADRRDDEKRYRYLAAQTLLDCADVLKPPEALKSVLAQLAPRYQAFVANPAAWHGLEACLYCIRSIARKVDNKESTVMPQVMELLPRLSNNPHLRYTATLIIGRYSDWLNKCPEKLPKLLSFVVGGLNDKEVMSSAALAFKHICDCCGQHLVKPPFLESLFKVYNTSLVSLPFLHQKEVIEGAALVVSQLPPADVLGGLMTLVQPIAKAVHEAVSQPEPLPAGQQDKSIEVAVNLDRLAEIFKALDPTEQETPTVAESTVEVCKKLWALFEQVVKRYINDAQKIEKVCRCWKYAMKAAGKHFLVLLPSLVAMLATSFKLKPHFSFMYTMSVCVSEFAHHEQSVALITAAFKVFADVSLALLPDQNALVELPDIVDNLFDMATRFLKKRPDVMFATPLLSQLFHKAVQSIGVPHREACRSVLMFLGTFVSAGTNNPQMNEKRQAAVPQQHVTYVQQQLQQLGLVLSDGLLLGVAGQLPRRHLKFVTGVLDVLLTFSREWCQQVFPLSLAKVPETTYPTKEEFLQGLMGPRRSPSDFRQWRDLIQDWSTACRRHLH